MTKARLEEVVKAHGLTVDMLREGAGKFRDVIIGTGAAWSLLHTVAQIVREESGMSTSFVKVTTVSNPEHEQYGKPYLSVESFWWE